MFTRNVQISPNVSTHIPAFAFQCILHLINAQETDID